MSRNVRIEEVDDDPEETDISTLFPTNTPFFDPAPVVPAIARPTGGSQPPPQASAQPTYLPSPQASAFKSYQCLYPVYFDSTRSRSEGRKVPKSHTVENPLAREIVDACAMLGLKTVFEPGKIHPKDWGNPGRVRVLLKEDGEAVDGDVKNKFVLMLKVGEYLKAHPTTQQTPLKLHMQGVPFDPSKPPEPPVVPRGWKLGKILPLHSPALSGGGVSEDIFKEMMGSMGMGDTAGGPSGGGEPKAIKEKKKKGKR